MHIDIKSIDILIRRAGTDKVFVYTSLPSPFPLEVSVASLILSFDVMHGGGTEYVRKHFPGVPMNILPTSEGV
jgi:hypothetical protein